MELDDPGERYYSTFSLMTAYEYLSYYIVTACTLDDHEIFIPFNLNAKIKKSERRFIDGTR